jgi:hypothetical protein
MGSSHTQGKEVQSSKRYSSIVSDVLSEGKEELFTYNIACEKNPFPTIIEHFHSAVANYPNASCVTIEIYSTDYSEDDINAAMLQEGDINTTSAELTFAQLGTRAKLKNFVKEVFPLLSIIKNRFATAKNKSSTDVFSFEKEEYYSTVYNALSLIKSEYNGPIAILYHPEVTIQSDGSMTIERSQTYDLFVKACETVGIDFLDMGDAFIEYYEEYYKLPYGFANTTPGNGHLNKNGHKIIADAILDYLGEDEK